MTVVWWILGILAVLFLVYLWLIAPAAKKPDDSALKGWLYAHRGLHDGNHQVAENSLEAFRRAVEAGYGMELDVQLTADDQLVVFHDKSLKRVCGMDKDLYTQTYAQLMEYPLPDGSKIPLFSEVLALVDGEKVRVESVEDPSRYFDLNMLDIVVVPATFGKYRVVNKGIGVAVIHKTMLKP